MDFAALLDWWRGKRDRLPLPGKLADFATVVSRYNRLLVTKTTVVTNAGGTVTIAADSTRVGLVVTGQFNLGATNTMLFQINTPTSTVFSTEIVQGEADVALVTPSPIIYTPLIIDITQLGPLIQQALFGNVSAGTGKMFINELLLNPELDLGGVQQASVKSG